MRDDLVKSAVQFLNDPQVANSSLAKRVEFLESKKLSPEEIEEALKQAQSPTYSTGSTTSTSPPPRPQLQPPPPVPQRDWKDYFVMATVSVGVAYGMYEVARRYVLPMIIPPTPPALEADKEALEREFARTEALVQQMGEDTAALKQAEQTRAEQFDQVMNETREVVDRIKKQAEERRHETRLALAIVEQLRDQLPRSLQQYSEQQEQAIADLQTELKSLKQLVSNRVRPGTGPPPASAVPSSIPGFRPAKAAATPPSQSQPPAPVSNNDFIPTPGGAIDVSSTTNGASGSNRPTESSQTPESTTGTGKASTPQSGSETKPGIPAWQLTAEAAK